MNRIKNNVKGAFTVAPNDLINDFTLSSYARMLYIYMASKPDGWVFNNSDLMNAIGVKSSKTFRKYLAELLAHGWITRSEQNREGGIFGNFDYDIHPSALYPSTDVQNLPCGKSSVAETFRSGKNTAHNNKESIVINTNTHTEAKTEIKKTKHPEELAAYFTPILKNHPAVQASLQQHPADLKQILLEVYRDYVKNDLWFMLRVPANPLDQEMYLLKLSSRACTFIENQRKRKAISRAEVKPVYHRSANRLN